MRIMLARDDPPELRTQKRAMDPISSSFLSRRDFLATSGGIVGAAISSSSSASASPGTAQNSVASAPASLRKIPIGVFDPVYSKLSLDEMIDKISALGIE